MYEYDLLDRVKTLKLKTSGVPETLYSNSYDSTGRLTQRDYSNGMKEVFGYDAKDRLVSHTFSTSTQTVFEYKYQYDPAGNMIQRDIHDNNMLNRRDLYRYDYINQLTKIDVPGNKDLEYSYDKHYNRQIMNHAFGSVSYNYDLATNELLSYEESNNPSNPKAKLRIEYQYNKQGNPLLKKFKDTERNQVLDQENYTWNDRDELTGITGRVTQSYEYDYRGLRTLKVVQKSPTQSAVYRYVYLQNHQPAVKTVTSTPLSDRSYSDVFVYDGSRRVMRIRVKEDGSIAQKEFFINDYLGNPVVVASSMGEVRYQQYADPFGNKEMEVGYPTSNTEFRFTDKEQDEDSDLYYFQARYYDSTAGRFLSRDPVTIESKLSDYSKINSFVFVKNNPMRYIDPDGNGNLDVVWYGANVINNASYGVLGIYSYKNLDVSRISQMVCNEFISIAYHNGGEEDFPLYDYTNKSGKKIEGWVPSFEEWFKDHGKLLTGGDVKAENLEAGDVLFFSNTNGVQHVAMIAEITDKGFKIQGAHNSTGTSIIDMNFKSIKDVESYFKKNNYSVSAIGQQTVGSGGFKNEKGGNEKAFFGLF